MSKSVYNLKIFNSSPLIDPVTDDVLIEMNQSFTQR